MSGLVRWFKGTLKSRPLLTNTIIYGSFYAAAELSQQLFNKHYTPEKPEINYVGAARIITTGTGVYAPSLFYWYKYLDRTFVGSGTKVVVNKLAREQLFMGPFLLCMFFLVNSILERKEKIFDEEFKTKYTKALIYNQLFWVPAQTINFWIVPSHLRVVYVAVLSFAWINILCFVKRQNVEKSKSE